MVLSNFMQIILISSSLLLLSIVGIIIKINWEKIQKWKLKNFYYQSIVRVVIHYEGNKTKTYFRKIPSNKEYKIDDKIYSYDSESVIKSYDKFAIYNEDLKKYILTCDGKKYKVEEDLITKEKKDDDIVSIHYWYNVPTPINFDCSKENIELSSYQMNEMKINDLFAKLLRLDEQNAMLLIIIVITCILVLMVGFNLYYSYKTNKALTDYIKVVTDTSENLFLLWGCSYGIKKVK